MASMNNTIKQNVHFILTGLPSGVQLVAAVKTRTSDEIIEAIDAGIRIIGENYVQEAEGVYNLVRNRVKLHFIGHLQRNKVKKTVALFDMIETVDSLKIAVEIDKRCAQIGKTMPVLIEINSGCEEQKSGVFPKETEKLVRKLAKLLNIKVMGLMTMGPRVGNPEDSRSYFKTTKYIFDRIRELNIPNIEMRYLSMGMTNSYKVALDEGANIIRVGSLIFGERQYGVAI